jgi:hypothetical protein
MGLIIVFGALGLALLVSYALSTFKRFRARSVELICPADHSTVQCIVEEDLAHEHHLAVVNCSRLDPPGEVTCHQRCLMQLE